MTAPAPTKTFWPNVQPGPTRAPAMTWQKCQIRVPSPMAAGASTTAVGCAQNVTPAPRDRALVGHADVAQHLLLGVIHTAVRGCGLRGPVEQQLVAGTQVKPFADIVVDPEAGVDEVVRAVAHQPGVAPVFITSEGCREEPAGDGLAKTEIADVGFVEGPDERVSEL